MTLEEYYANLGKLAEVSSQRALDSIVAPAANELLAKIKNRISQDGKNTQGANIGNYSTTPEYYSKSQFVKQGSFRNVGKTGKKTKSTMYLPQGYKQLRQIQGREVAHMNYEYSGDTLLKYQAQDTGGAVLLGFTTEKASIIRKALEQKRGLAFYATQEEIEAYSKQVEDESRELTLTILGSV